MDKLASNRKAFIFLESMPQPSGSGAHLRFYSNVRAYLDNEFDVELVQLTANEDYLDPSKTLGPVKFSRVIVDKFPLTSLIGRVMFRLGIPGRESTSVVFPLINAVIKEAQSRFREYPNAIYHFDGESLACAIPWLPASIKAIWSLHDLPSTNSRLATETACRAEGRQPTVPELRDQRFKSKLERLMARKSKLVLCIGNHDAKLLHDEWKCANAHFLPMSIPDERVLAGQDLTQRGKIRLLHVGRISHLPSYTSLIFLLEEVFPKLPPSVLDKLEFRIVGRIDDDKRVDRVFALAKVYPNVSFEGFVDDIAHIYRECDLQIIASNDTAGLRTRMIESFAFGVPVLSTSVTAGGISGLIPQKHLLIADSADEFIEILKELSEGKVRLSYIASNARKFYFEKQSRASVAGCLRELISEFLG